MRARLITAPAVCAAAMAVAAVLVPAGDAASSAVRHPARMLVYAQEWSLWASRGTLPSGPVIVQLSNRGQDAHDLHVRRLDRHNRLVGSAQALGVTESGARGQTTWRLRPGRYELYCSLPGHFQRGMHTIVVVH
jgi:hypothetical protein